MTVTPPATQRVPDVPGAPDRLGRRGRWAVAAVTALSLAWFLAIGVVRYHAGLAGNYDLGIFSQAAAAWSSGHWPGSSIRGVPNLLADHFSPVTALYGLAWAVRADPRALIAAQALALAAAIGLIAVAWSRALGARVGVPVAAAVALGKPFVAAAFFDVHEVGLGVPLTAGLCWGLHARRLRPVWVCGLLLLLVKEDLGLTVAAAGPAWWLLHRRRRAALRPALALVGAGLAGVALAFAVVFAVSGHQSLYLGSLHGDTAALSAGAGPAVAAGSRLPPLLLFVAASGVLGLVSPIALLAVPTLGWRLLSANPSYWQTYFHYDLMLGAIAAFALLDAVVRVVPRGEREPTRWPAAARSRPAALRAVVVLLAGGGLAVSAAMGVAKAASLPLTDPASLRPAPVLRAAAELAAGLPRGAAVAAEQRLGPPLIARVDVHMLSTFREVPVRWVLLDEQGSTWGAPQPAKAAWLAQVTGRPGVRVVRRGSVVLVDLVRVQPVRLPPTLAP